MINTSNISYRLLAGSCRSGATWMLDALCKANALRAVFKPSHPRSWHMARDFTHKYASAEHDWPELDRFWQCTERAQYSMIWCGSDQLYRCLEKLKSSGWGEIQKVLDLFGFTVYHTDTILPEVSVRSKAVPQCWAGINCGSA